MWDNPRLLNSAAGLLVVVAALLFAFAGLQFLVHSPLFPIRELEVDHGLKHATRQQIEAAVRASIAGNFFAVDLSAIRAAIEQRSEEHTSELQSLAYLVCRLLLEKKKKTQ